jgi:hypothetical protein
MTVFVGGKEGQKRKVVFEELSCPSHSLSQSLAKPLLYGSSRLGLSAQADFRKLIGSTPSVAN